MAWYCVQFHTAATVLVWGDAVHFARLGTAIGRIAAR